MGTDFLLILPTRPEKIEAVSKAVESEITLAWARKSSFEVRAFSLITANLAIVTIYFALELQLGFSAHTKDTPTRALVIVSLVLLVASIVAAGLSAVPRDYPGMEAGGFQDYLREAAADEPHDLVAEMVEFRIVQLEAATRSNQAKGVFLLVAFVGLAAGIAALAAALLLASL